MTIEDMPEGTGIPRRQRGEPEDDRGRKVLLVRNALNIIFMLGAVIGIAVYVFSDHVTGMYVIVAAIPFKIAEAVIRMLKI